MEKVEEKKFEHEALSPSRINFFIECPGGWAAKYLLGYETPVTDSMMQGSLVEDYVNLKLLQLKKAKGINLSDLEQEIFTELSVQSWDDLDPQGVKLGEMGHSFMLGALKNSFHDLTLQTKIWYEKDERTGIQGYMDYCDGANIYDLKVTKAAPYRPRMNHIRQMVIYSIATGIKNLHLVYLVRQATPKLMIWSTDPSTSKSHHTITPELITKAKWDIAWAIQQMRFHMDLYIKRGMIVVPVDFSHYRMSGMDIEGIRKDLLNAKGQTNK